jgi:hypothetical protein
MSSSSEAVIKYMAAGIVPSVSRYEPGWKELRIEFGGEGGGGEIFHVVQTDPKAYLASCATDTVSFWGINRPERGADRPPLSSARLRIGLSCTFASPLCLHRHVVG